MRKKLTEADWNALKQEMRQILIGMAKLRQTVCYSDLAAMLQSAYIHHRSPEFPRLITDMSREDELSGHASLAPLVVRKDSGIPGMGFFINTAVETGDLSDMEAFWRKEFERTCEYWSDK